MARMNTFDPSAQEADSGGFEPIPNGEYELSITDSDWVPTKSGNGMLLKLTYQVAEGQKFAGRMIFDQLCLEHENVQTEEIAKKRLTAICQAIGHKEPVTDSEVLHHRPFVAKVGTEGERYDEKSGKTYPARNLVKVFLSENAPPLPLDKPNGKVPARAKAEPVKAAPPTTAKAPGNRPWAKGA